MHTENAPRILCENAIRVDRLSPGDDANPGRRRTVGVVGSSGHPDSYFHPLSRLEVERYSGISTPATRSISATRAAASAVKSAGAFDRGETPGARSPRLFAVFAAATAAASAERKLRGGRRRHRRLAAARLTGSATAACVGKETRICENLI